jgi:hypothetical protein
MESINISRDSSKYISIIVCHCNRLKCILKKFLKKYHKYIYFKNGAIVRLEISKNNIFLDLVDEGVMKKTDIKKYSEQNPKIEFYTKDNGLFHKFQRNESTLLGVFRKLQTPASPLPGQALQGSAEKKIKTNLEYLSGLDNNTYIFYLIRHSKITKINDCSLTVIDDILTNYGVRQSLITSKKLIKILKENDETNIDYLFTSELRRSRLTIGIIIYELLNNNLIKIKNKNTNIIPCLHELYNKYDNYCKERNDNPYDYQIIKYDSDKKLVSEEVIIYNLKNIYIKINKNTSIIIGYKSGQAIQESAKNSKKKIIQFNWAYYLNYFNSIRERIIDQKKCTNINIIKTIIKEINKETFKQ